DTDPREPQPIGMEQWPAQAVPALIVPPGIEAPQLPSLPSDTNIDLVEMLCAAEPSLDAEWFEGSVKEQHPITLWPNGLQRLLAWANARRDAAVGSAKIWRPIETAPQDGSRILLLRNGRIVCGNWNDDRYARKPRPYWSHDQERAFGTVDTRQCQPTHWQPLPASVTEARDA